jgi:segregation and condensation protein B
MEPLKIKQVIEVALLGAGRPLSLEQLSGLFGKRGAPSRQELRDALAALEADYEDRGIQLKQVASGYRIQIRKSMSDWLAPLWEERPPRYSRALLETLALIAYRQPITRGEIEEVRGVVVSTNIIRTLLERGWVRVLGHRDVPGKPAMFGTTREFLDYFGLTKLDELPPLSEIRDLDDLNVDLGLPEPSPQQDLVDELQDESNAAETAAAESSEQVVEAASGDVIPITRSGPA